MKSKPYHDTLPWTRRHNDDPFSLRERPFFCCLERLRYMWPTNDRTVTSIRGEKPKKKPAEYTRQVIVMDGSDLCSLIAIVPSEVPEVGGWGRITRGRYIGTTCSLCSGLGRHRFTFTHSIARLRLPEEIQRRCIRGGPRVRKSVTAETADCVLSTLSKGRLQGYPSSFKSCLRNSFYCVFCLKSSPFFSLQGCLLPDTASVS
jgi:hypothetical protein